MKVSIIIPVRNDPRVGRAIESVLAQEHEHELELIVIDAASTDETPQIIENYRNRITVHLCEPDRGIYDGMNKGIAAATGEIVGILGSDDRYIDSSALRSVTDAFSDEEIGIVYANVVYTSESGRTVRYWQSSEHSPASWRLGWMPPHAGFFVRCDLYRRHGAFDLQFPIAADYDLILRFLLKHRIRSRFLNRVIVNMAPGGTSNRSVANVIRANLEVRRAWRKNGLRGGQLVPFLKPARKLFQLLRVPAGIRADG